MAAMQNFLQSTGFFLFSQGENWKCLLMILIACVLLYLGIRKKFEPLLLVPIAFGMLLTNLPGAEMFHEILFAGGHIHWDLFGGGSVTAELLASCFDRVYVMPEADASALPTSYDAATRVVAMTAYAPDSGNYLVTQ